MTQDMILEVFRQAMIVAIKIAGPLLIISMCVGLVIAVFQAATQIHEQTLTFVPKAATITILLMLLSPNMINTVTAFVKNIFEIITQISQHTSVL